MSDLIERDKAIDVLDDFQSNVENCVGNAYAIARQQMIAIPSARPKEGKWILECDGEGECDNLYRCSECGCKYGCQEYDIPNFCPNCGSDNREREGE